jgi:hypothetical protein
LNPLPRADSVFGNGGLPPQTAPKLSDAPRRRYDPAEMNDLLDQIDIACQHPNLYYLALTGALTVPDIAGAVDAADGRATGARYIGWFDRWAGAAFPPAGVPGHQVPTLTGQRCYWFRCGLLHQGLTAQPDPGVERILFIESGNVFHNNMFNKVLNLDVRLFCTSITASARTWIEASRGTEPFDSNLDRVIRRYPAGWPPVVVGATVIT